MLYAALCFPKYINILLLKYTNKYTNTQIHKYTNTFLQESHGPQRFHSVHKSIFFPCLWSHFDRWRLFAKKKLTVTDRNIFLDPVQIKIKRLHKTSFPVFSESGMWLETNTKVIIRNKAIEFPKHRRIGQHLFGNDIRNRDFLPFMNSRNAVNCN